MKTANSAAGQRVLSHSNVLVPNKQKKVMLDIMACCLTCGMQPDMQIHLLTCM